VIVLFGLVLVVFTLGPPLLSGFFPGLSFFDLGSTWAPWVFFLVRGSCYLLESASELSLSACALLVVSTVPKGSFYSVA